MNLAIVKSIIEENSTTHKYIFKYDEDEKGFNSLLIMESIGKAFCRLYYYVDDLHTYYLDWLTVDEDVRKQKIGTTLQIIREQVAAKLGAKKIYLYVNKNAWMYHWYFRRGYRYDGEHNENGYVWMKKDLTLPIIEEMKNDTKVWFQSGMSQNSRGIIKSYAGEGYYWVLNIEKLTLHYCFMLDIIV